MPEVKTSVIQRVVTGLLMAWVTVSVAHDWKELNKPVIDDKTTDVILASVEQLQQSPSEEVSSLGQESDAVDWVNWLNEGLSLDTRQGQQLLEEQLMALGYRKDNEDEPLFLWRTDMEFIAELYDESERQLTEGESVNTLTHYHFTKKDIAFITPFKGRLSVLINQAKGRSQ